MIIHFISDQHLADISRWLGVPAPHVIKLKLMAMARGGGGTGPNRSGTNAPFTGQTPETGIPGKKITAAEPELHLRLFVKLKPWFIILMNSLDVRSFRCSTGRNPL